MTQIPVVYDIQPGDGIFNYTMQDIMELETRVRIISGRHAERFEVSRIDLD